MGLDDFAPTGIKTVAKRALAPEDEDLFDFPVLEMTYEGDRANARHAVASVVPVPAPSANAPAASASAAPAKAAPKSAPAPAKSATPKSAAPKATSSKTEKTRANAAPKTAATTAHSDVQPAADLIDQLEEALDERRTLERSSRRRTPGARFALPLGTPRVLLGGMLMLNVLTFAFFWVVSQSFRSGIESLRDDLLLATRNTPLVSTPPSVQAAPVAHEPAPDEPVAKSTHADSVPAHPLDAFEQTTLALAAKEIGAGEFIAARKRLNRLLAVADRIDATLKADIEARARFLIAESYHAQGATKAAHLEAAVHANEAAARTPAPVQVPPKAEGH